MGPSALTLDRSFLASVIESDPDDGHVVRADHAPLVRVLVEDVPVGVEMALHVEAHSHPRVGFDHAVTVQVAAANGTVVADIPAQAFPSGNLRINLNFNPIVFPGYGDYTFTVFSDGEPLTQLPLRVEIDPEHDAPPSSA